MTPAQKMMVALVVGAATGLFAGEFVEPLRIVADGYVKLLQMTVLPYLMVSLISGLGGLSLAHARAWRGGWAASCCCSGRSRSPRSSSSR